VAVADVAAMRGWFCCGLLCSSLIGCRGDVAAPVPGAAPSDAAPPEDEAEPPSARPVDVGGQPARVDAPAEAGQAPAPDRDCAAEPVTLAEIAAGRVRDNLPISAGALVASSQKFLVAEAKSGSCLWGAFAADPERSGPGSGILLVSFGKPHQEREACRPGGDGLPDDLAPGDVVEARGFVDEFVPAACKDLAPSRQLRVDAECPLRRTGRGEPPEPAMIDVELADRLAQGSDASLLRDWGGALVSLSTVSALQDPDDGDGVFPFGVVRLAETRLEVSSRLYYFDLSEGGPRATTKSPRYGYPTTFAAVTGLLLLDYCTWVLAPRDRCVDAPGVGCADQATGP
jgi:hypothetical protein